MAFPRSRGPLYIGLNTVYGTVALPSCQRLLAKLALDGVGSASTRPYCRPQLRGKTAFKAVALFQPAGVDAFFGCA